MTADKEREYKTNKIRHWKLSRIVWDHIAYYSKMYFIALLYSSVYYTINDIHKGLISKNNTTRFKLPLKKLLLLLKLKYLSLREK